MIFQNGFSSSVSEMALKQCYLCSNKITSRSFPGSARQCRGHGFDPWSGRIPHAAEWLGPCATATEPALWRPQATTAEPAYHNYWGPCAWSRCSATGEVTAMGGPRTMARSGPRSPQLQKAHAQQWSQRSLKWGAGGENKHPAPRSWSPVPLSSKRNQSSLKKQLIPSLGGKVQDGPGVQDRFQS